MVLVVLGVQEEWMKRMGCLVINNNVQAEAERKPFGNEGEVRDAGEVVGAAGPVEKYIDSWSPHACAGYGIQKVAKVAIAGCRESWGSGARWGCRRGLRGLPLGGYTMLQMSLVGCDRVAETGGYWREDEKGMGTGGGTGAGAGGSWGVEGQRV